MPKGTTYVNRGLKLTRPYPFCELVAKWHGLDCAEMWPASKFAWCQPCRDFAS